MIRPKDHKEKGWVLLATVASHPLCLRSQNQQLLILSVARTVQSSVCDRNGTEGDKIARKQGEV
jgi:hypothetical protein